ncbi:MAG TPA: DUF4962 domain-containing protein [Pyrinomonadaceae bacterium]|nr:DUF4962 domain-containing protein [Pyrinomonadaceae bacterium]
MMLPMHRSRLFLFSVSVALTLSISVFTNAQDVRELQDEKTTSNRIKGEHPLIQLMRTRNSRLKPELVGLHPRVYLTENEFDALRLRSRTTHKELWQQVLSRVRALNADPPAPPAQKRREQNDVGLAIAEAAFVYKVEHDDKYLKAAKKFMDAAVSYDIWGYANNKPNVDLAAGHLLYGMGWAYDLLYNDLTDQERARYRQKLIKQAKLVADYFQPKPGKTFAYSQNHTFIPISGLAVTAYALYGETSEAAGWAQLARAIFDRVLQTYSRDGYYYEGFEYWIFSTPWIVHYLDAHLHATGEDLYDHPGLRNMHKYVAHSMLPTGQYVFDFGDIFEGPLTRAGQGDEYPRTHPNGRFHTNYNLLFRLAQRFENGEAQGIAQWLSDFKQVNAEDFWSLVWFDPGIRPIPIQQQTTWHYFDDHDVVVWRSDWSPNATAFAFKCGPSEGHHAAPLLKQFPDWRLSSGHAHPDANSFIIFANGKYLIGDTGYAGVPMTEHHNTVLLNGRGQAKEGRGHDAFAGVDYELINRIRIVEVQVDKDHVLITGDATSAYDAELGLKKFVRTFEYRAAEGFLIRDEIETLKPATFTSVIHADSGLKKDGERRFVIERGEAKLSIDVIQPPEVRTTIDVNTVTAPGPPGAVDKGEQQERGQKLLVSTAQPSNKVNFVIRLKIPNVGTTQSNGR